MNILKRFINNESGATAIEYGLIAVGIAVVIMGTVGLVGQELDATFSTVKETLAAGNGG